MMDKEKQPNKNEQKWCLTDSVLNQIEHDQIAPTPRWRFICHEYAIWGLWVASVVIGAVALSVMIFVSLHAGYAFYEATHDSAWDFFVEVLPFIWMSVFVAMVGLAYFNIRHTKKGYRYPLWQLVISSLFLSIVGGGLLHAAGLGYFIDQELSENMPMVKSFIGTEHKMWQAPDKGRMVGVFEGFTNEGADEALFVTIDGSEWTISVGELMQKDLDLLVSGDKVRILGMVASGTNTYFYSCGVIPWMLEKPMPMSKLREERDMFMERLEHHVERVGEGVEGEPTRPRPAKRFSFGANTKTATGTETHCPEMPLLQKMRPQLAL